jgi:predicted dehydrogenase
MEAFLQLCASGTLRLEPLVSHRFPIERAEEAYAAVGAGDPLGVILQYAAREPPPRTISVSSPRARQGAVGVGLIGAGAFVSSVLAPAVAAAPGVRLVTIASARGFSARHLAERLGFEQCSTDADAVIASADVDAVFVATRHHLHASQAAKALRAGKHVFVEKPLALTREELADVLAAWRSSGRVLAVGFNRRFSPLAAELRGFFEKRAGPLVMHYRVNAGQVPADSWIHDPAVGGGRILGEACHFIDLCSFVAGAGPVSVYAQGVEGRGAARADDNVTLSLKLGDGSLATIGYVATGDAAAGKERLEVLGDGAQVVLDDFQRLTLRRGGKERVIRRASQDKGHAAGVAAFVRAVREGGPPPVASEIVEAVSLATLAAVESLATGEPVRLG